MPSICKKKSIFALSSPKVDIILKFVYSANQKTGFSPKPSTTVDGRGKISEPHATGTSKLDWRSLESMQIDRNKVQIRTNWQKGTGTKNLKFFLGMSKYNFVLDHLVLSLVKFGKLKYNRTN